MVSGEAPAANFPQGAIIFVVVRQILVTFETVWERSRGPGPLAFLARKEVNVLLRNCLTFKTVVTIFVNPL
jgi:hypothetical protein